MKIINTFKKYFKNNEFKNNLSLTSTDNVYDKYNDKMYDRMYEDLKMYVDTLVRYNNPQIYNFSDTEDFWCNNLKLFIVGNIAYLTGTIYPKASGKNGAYNIPLPMMVFPKVNGVLEWCPVVIDGVTYKIHYQIENPYFSVLNIFFYDTIPQASVPINMVIPLSPNYISHTE